MAKPRAAAAKFELSGVGEAFASPPRGEARVNRGEPTNPKMAKPRAAAAGTPGLIVLRDRVVTC